MGSCATQGEKAAIVKELYGIGYKLKYLLSAMQIPKSTYYFELGKVDLVHTRNVDLLEEIEKIYISNKRRYGVRRI